MAPPPQLPSKTSSSPGRTEKLPTPGFAPLVCGNGGSRSRSRSQTSLSRSSPLFPSRNRSFGRATSSLDAGNDGEPSSPRVTCIGQVRIRKNDATPIRSDSTRNSAQSEMRNRGEREMRCCCVDKGPFERVLRTSSTLKHSQESSLYQSDSQRAQLRQTNTKSLLFNVFSGRSSVWRRWPARHRLKGNAGYRRGNERVEPTEAVPPALNDLVELDCHKSELADDDEVRGCDDESKTRLFAPPKNALLLMRCRSAPHNQSSIVAARFSAASDGDDDDKKEEIEKGIESNNSHEEDEAEEEQSRCPSSRPLFLKRCNSVPAKKAATLAAQHSLPPPLKA